MLRAVAVLASTASCNRPAPARRADTPASSTAPGVVRDPPTTRTVPRDFLSPWGSGSGHSRSRAGVMTASSDRFGIDVLLLGRSRALAMQVLDHIELFRLEVVADPSPAADRGVRDAGGPGHRHQLLLAELLGQVPHEQH